MSESEQSGAGRREVAYRMFAAEFEDADYSYSESDEERAPNYVVTPTGARANRLFLVGVLTEVEEVSEDVLRGRVVDPTGGFVLYAGQYQPDEQAFLDRAETPTFVAVTGKARTFSPEDSEQVFTSIRPESISEVDAATRDRWTVQAAEQTVERVGWMATALSLELRGEDLRKTLVDHGVDDGLAHGIQLALDHYGTTPAYLAAVREMAVDAARFVTDDVDDVRVPTTAPSTEGDSTVEELLESVEVETRELDPDPVTPEAIEPTETADDEAEAGTPDATESEAAESPDVDTAETTDAETAEPTGTEDAESRAEPAEPSDTEDVETTDAEAGESAGEERTEPSIDEQADAPDPERSNEFANEPATGPATEASAGGESTSAESESTGESTAEDDLGDFDADEFELEAETREEIEEEYGTDFQTGTEVDDPGEAGIETPDGIDDEPPATEPEDGESDPGEVQEDDTTPEATGTAADDAAGDADEPDDLQAAVVELMSDLDTGDGADRDDLVAEMEARYGTDRSDVEAAIQDALMDGECYEPDDSTLKPI